MKRTITPNESADEERQQEQIRRNQAVIDLLNAWERENPEEQRETLEFLMRALDEDRARLADGCTTYDDPAAAQ